MRNIKKLILVLLLETIFFSVVFAQNSVVVDVDAKRKLGELKPFWANQIIHPTDYVLTEWGKNFINLLKETGAAKQYIRIYNQPEVAIRINDNGQIYYDWSKFDEMAKLILASGNKLAVVFFGMPEQLALYPESLRKRPFGVNVSTSPPKDYLLWEELCRDFTKHVVTKYGIKEVKQWTFRCWNEPDGGFWYKHDLKEYLKLYDFFAKAVKEVHPDIKIGGPALTGTITYKKPENFKFILEHLCNGTNHATGKTGSPVDFLSIHTYGGSNAGAAPGKKGPDVDYLIEQQIRCADMRDEYLQLRKIPIYVEEWGESTRGTTGTSIEPIADVRNSQYAAAFMTTWVERHIKIKQQHDRGFEKFIYCSSGYEGIRTHDFMGFRTLDTKNGYHKPILNAYKLLNKLASEMVYVKINVENKNLSAFATSDSKRLTVVITNYQSEKVNNDGDSFDFVLNIKTLWNPKSKVVLKHWRIDDNHSNSYTAYKKAGSPNAPTPIQIDAIKSKMELETLEIIQDMNVADLADYKMSLPCNAVSLIEIIKK